METKRTTLGLDLETMKGFDYDNYDPARLPKLPPEEERLWYSKFYYRGRGEVAPELRAAVAPGHTIDPAKALLPGDLDSLTEPGHIEGDLGFSVSPRERDPQFAGLIGGNSWIENLDPAVERRAMLLFHYIRTLPTGGIEFRTHLYTGLFAKSGGWEIVQDIDPAVCLEATRRMAAHCIYERANINNFLPELYEKMKDQPLADPEFVDEGLALKE